MIGYVSRLMGFVCGFMGYGGRLGWGTGGCWLAGDIWVEIRSNRWVGDIFGFIRCSVVFSFGLFVFVWLVVVVFFR